jgi:pyrroloquinoline quinone biosynthesis protein E
VTNKYTTDSAKNLCPWPFERAFVSSDLRVVPCCIIANPDVSEVGVIDKDFASVWKGETMTKFREAHLQGEIPDVCAFCYKNRKQNRATAA